MYSSNITLAKIIKNVSLEVVFASKKDARKILILSNTVNKLGLELIGFLDFYDRRNILLISEAEHTFLGKLKHEKRLKVLNRVLNLGSPPAIIITDSLNPYKEILDIAKEREIYILSSEDDSYTLMGSLNLYLRAGLAPKIVRHGVLLEIYGMGVFITGESGIGKSETAVELIKRGHRVVADDAVEIKKISKNSLMGSAPKNLRYFMELRGIGIINIKKIFGMASIKLSEKIDLVIQLETWENWNKTFMYDRMGMEDNFIKILETEIPFMRIPVKPGRNLAVIIEVATMDYRQRRMGENAAKELLDKLGIKK